MKALGEFEVWFLTGSQDLYGEETLRQVAAHSERIAAGLSESAAIPVRVVCKPVVKSPEGILAACLEATASAACVGVIAWMHTFSPARMWIAGLQALQKPLLHLHTQFNRDLPWGEIDMDFMNLNQAAHGDREFGHIETRLGVARKTVAGHWQDPVVADRIGSWTRAACAWHEAHHLKVARFGDNMRQVAVTEGDKVEAQIRLGVAINGYSVSDLADAVRAVPEATVDLLIEDYEASYDLAPSLRVNGADREALREAARIEAALRAFLTEGGFGAFTDTFENLDGLRQLPGIACQRLMADGYGFGAEGDWKTGLMVRLLKVMARGLPGGTSFMEDYTYHLGPEGPKVLGAHMLEVCPTISDQKVSCEIHPLSIGGRSDPVRLVFDRRLGPGRGGRPHGHGRPVPPSGQRDRPGPAGQADAALAGRPRDLETAPGPVDCNRGLAHGRWFPPHRPEPRHRTGATGRLRRDGWTGVPAHRLRDDHPCLHEGASLEPGLLSPGEQPIEGS